jgi:hypothetical protein
MPGPGTAATLAAVRRAWDQGESVRVVSYRSGAADLSVPVAGPLAGRRLEQVRRHYGAPPSAVLVVQGGAPFVDAQVTRQLATAAGLALALRRFRRSTLVVAEDPHVAGPCLLALAEVTGECVVGSHEDARVLHDRYRIPWRFLSVEEVENFPPLAPGVEPSTAGLYRPGAARGLKVVEVPSGTLAQRLRVRAKLSRQRLTTRLRGH